MTKNEFKNQIDAKSANSTEMKTVEYYFSFMSE